MVYLFVIQVTHCKRSDDVLHFLYYLNLNIIEKKFENYINEIHSKAFI